MSPGTFQAVLLTLLPSLNAGDVHVVPSLFSDLISRSGLVELFVGCLAVLACCSDMGKVFSHVCESLHSLVAHRGNMYPEVACLDVPRFLLLLCWFFHVFSVVFPILRFLIFCFV